MERKLAEGKEKCRGNPKPVMQKLIGKDFIGHLGPRNFYDGIPP